MLLYTCSYNFTKLPCLPNNIKIIARIKKVFVGDL